MSKKVAMRFKGDSNILLKQSCLILKWHQPAYNFKTRLQSPGTHMYQFYAAEFYYENEIFIM